MWKKRDNLTTVEDVVQRNSGKTLEELLHPKNDSEIVHLEDAAKLIRSAIHERKHITVIGDYDADGICGSAILYKMLSALGSRPTVRLPRRFSEGYGFNFAMLDEVSDGLLITVDNGIAAVDEITEAKRRGIQVVILDHHLPRDDGILPPADVTVNPHVYNNGGFEDFCGAGLAYRLAELLLQDGKQKKELIILAAIATVADVVPLIDDNRSIVMEGLRALKYNREQNGLQILIERLGLFDVDESDISFTIAPVLNAAGRMLNDGADKAFHLLIDQNELDTKAKELDIINARRKEQQVEGLEIAEQIIAEDCLFGDPILVVCSGCCSGRPAIPEGLVGILAGKLSEKYKVPAIILTDSDKAGILKGSGRSYGNINLKELLDQASELLVAYGGHPKAVGLSVSENDVSALRTFLTERLSDEEQEEEGEVSYYDLSIKTEELESTIERVLKYAPYGEGNPRPVLRIEDQYLVPRGSYHYSFMGKGNEHIKLFCGRNTVAVGFGMGEQFVNLGEPIRLTMTGTVFVNKYIDRIGRHSKERQIRLKDIERASSIKNASPLLASIYANLEALGGTCGDGC